MSAGDDWTAEQASEFRKAWSIPGVGIGPLEVVPPPPKKRFAWAPAPVEFYPDNPFGLFVSDEVRAAMQRMSADRLCPDALQRMSPAAAAAAALEVSINQLYGLALQSFDGSLEGDCPRILAEQTEPRAMTKEQDALLNVVARILRGQLQDMPWPRRRDREDLVALDNALLACDPDATATARRAARTAELPGRAAIAPRTT